MNPKRIALIHPRLIRRGGLETRLLNYMEWFSNKGCYVTVYCFKRDESIALPKNVSVHQFNLKWIPKLYRHRYFSYLLKKEGVRSKHDFTLSLGRTNHQDAVLGPGNHKGFLRAFEKSASTLSDFEQIAMDRKAYENTDTILAASQFMANEIVEFFQTDAGNVHALYPPFNASKFLGQKNTSKSEARKSLGLPEKGKIIGILSSGHKMKGVPFLLETMSAVKGVTLVIAGAPLARIPENVKHLGFLEDPTLLYKALDATVLPSIYEAFGQVIVESLFSGTPVMVSENAGAKEVIPEGSGTVLPVGDKDAWVKAISDLPEKPENTESLIDPTKLSLDHHMSRMCQLVGLQL